MVFKTVCVCMYVNIYIYLYICAYVGIPTHLHVWMQAKFFLAVHQIGFVVAAP